MKTFKTLALTALLSATALGYSMSAQADNVASGAGVSAGSSVGAGYTEQMNDDASTNATTNSGLSAPNAINDQSRDGGSTAEDNYSNSSTTNSQVLRTKDSSSSDTIARSGTENNTGKLIQNKSNEVAAPSAEYVVTSDGQLQSTQIRSIQQSLKNQGYRVGAVDGIWGPRTASALRDYQGKNNLNASGNFDADTASSLNIRVEPASGNAMNGNSPVDAQDNGTSSQY